MRGREHSGPVRMLRAGDSQRVFDLTAPGDYHVGRTPESDVSLAEPTVSRRHAVISVSSSGATVMDQSSSPSRARSAARYGTSEEIAAAVP